MIVSRDTTWIKTPYAEAIDDFCLQIAGADAISKSKPMVFHVKPLGPKYKAIAVNYSYMVDPRDVGGHIKKPFRRRAGHLALVNLDKLRIGRDLGKPWFDWTIYDERLDHPLDMRAPVSNNGIQLVNEMVQRWIQSDNHLDSIIRGQEAGLDSGDDFDILDI